MKNLFAVALLFAGCSPDLGEDEIASADDDALVSGTYTPANMTKVGCNYVATDGTYSQSCNGEVSVSVSFNETGTYNFDLLARGQLAGGKGPHAVLKIDDVAAASADVAATINTHYTLSAPVTKGTHKVAIAFDNDANVNGQDRNLLIVSLAISLPLVAIADSVLDFTTVPALPVGAKSIYVSSAGVDSAVGSFSAPVQTLGQARKLASTGKGDRILLRQGDTFSGSIYLPSGVSDTAPFILGSYYDAKSGSRARPTIVGSGTVVTAAGKYTWVLGIHVSSSGESGVNGIQIGARTITSASHILVEDCRVEGFQDNLLSQGKSEAEPNIDITIRRCIIVDAHLSGADNKAQGIYAWGNRGLKIEDNVFDHNGWKTGVAGSHPVIFSHNFYIATENDFARNSDGSIDESRSVVIQRNLILQGAEYGAQLRCGGIIRDNVIVRNTLGTLLIGHGGEISGNVILEGKNLEMDDNLKVPAGASTTTARAWGMEFNHGGYPTFDDFRAKLTNNIIANAVSVDTPAAGAIAFSGNSRPFTWSGNKLHGWANPNGGQFQTTGFKNPGAATMANYNADVLGGTRTFADFVAKVRTQSRADGTWKQPRAAADIITHIRTLF